MEVYVDNMPIKSLEARDHVRDLKEMFDILHQYWMMLNHNKYAFGVSFEKFLGFMVNHRGIEANPIMIKALLETKSPTKVKEI